MAELSPAARAVLDAASNHWPGGSNHPSKRACVAAALRAAADLELQQPWPTSVEGCGGRWMRDQLLAIAAELEGQGDG